MSAENAIVKQVQEAYLRDRRIPHPAEIAVSERRGNVTLRGTLGSLDQIHAAVQIAKAVPKVEAVSNELSLDPRDRWQDGEVRGAVLQALMSNDRRCRPTASSVHVRDGWLTLAGEVKHQEDSDAAFETASADQGRGRHHERDQGRHGGHPLNGPGPASTGVAEPARTATISSAPGEPLPARRALRPASCARVIRDHASCVMRDVRNGPLAATARRGTACRTRTRTPGSSRPRGTQGWPTRRRRRG